MIKIKWKVSGTTNFQEEIYEDKDYSDALFRYEQVAEHLRCHEVKMTFTRETEEIVLHEEIPNEDENKGGG